MFDVSDILKNDTVKGLLQKAGLPEGKMDAVADVAVSTVQEKIQKDPSTLLGLLSDKENTPEECKFSKVLEGDFVKGLMSKVGLSEDMASKVSAVLPTILNQFSGKITNSLLGEKGQGIMDGLSSLTGSDKSKGGLGSMMGGLFGK